MLETITTQLTEIKFYKVNGNTESWHE